MESDLNIDTSPFQASSIDPSTIEINNRLKELGKTDVKWWECGASEYRRRRAAGETPFPKSVVLPNGRDFWVPVTEDRELKARVFGEEIPASNRKGVFYHIHGGGNVLGSCSA